jgi:hypothetical protein
MIITKAICFEQVIQVWMKSCKLISIPLQHNVKSNVNELMKDITRVQKHDK